MIKEYKEAAEYLRQKGALPYADLSNVEKRQSKSARSRRSGKVDTVKEEDEKNNADDNNKKKVKSPARTPVKKSPGKKKDTKESKKEKGATDAADKEKGGDKKTADGKEVDKNIGLEISELIVVSQGTEGTQTEEEKPREKSAERKAGGSRGQSPSKSGDNKETANEKDKKKPAKVLPKKPSADSVLEKEDGIRTSNVSLRSEESVHIVEGERFKYDTSEPIASPINSMGTSTSKPRKDEGKYISMERIDPKEEDELIDEPLPRTSTREGQRSKVGFHKSHRERDRTDYTYDSGNETDPGHSRSRSRFSQMSKATGKAYIDRVRKSVMSYQTKRNNSRSLQQLKRAQIHTGPMHDIVMFSRMMDNYRKGITEEEEEELDLRNYANWDGYLNGE